MHGVLMFAHDNGLFDYGTMAYLSACTIRYHLGDPPICLVTDDMTWYALLEKHPMAEGLFMDPIMIEPPDASKNIRSYKIGDEVKKVEYLNHSRMHAFDLSPFDETLMIDTDVLVLDDRLKMCWGSKNQMMINRHIGRMLNPYSKKPFVRKMQDTSLDILWATVTYFQRTRMVAKFFEMVKRIRDDFDYYGMLYNFPVNLYRNDYAFTLASHMMGGHVGAGEGFIQPLPVQHLTFAWEKDRLVDVERGRALFRVSDGDQEFPVAVRETVHCMNKQSMLDNTEAILNHYA